MNKEFRVEANNQTVVKFDEIKFDEIMEIEEIVTADMGTVQCCQNS